MIFQIYGFICQNVLYFLSFLPSVTILNTVSMFMVIVYFGGLFICLSYYFLVRCKKNVNCMLQTVLVL